MSLQAAEPRVVVDKRVQLGEGSLWDDRAGVLYWVDIAGRTLHRFDPRRSSDSEVDIGEQVTTVVPTEQGGQVIVGLENSVALVDPATGKRLHSVPLEADFSENRCNDGKCGPGGRFYIGTMSTVRRTGSASLYRVDPDFSVSTCFGGVTVSNGIVWSADERTVYYIDTSTVSIDRIDFDPETGELGNRHPIIEVPPHYGKPDGMTIDREGRLWVAMFHGACVTVWDPQSRELVEKIDIPAKNITSVAFGGEQLSTLYVTTAAIGLNPEDFERYPASGTLIAVETNTQGRPAYRFGGSAGGDSAASPTVSGVAGAESVHGIDESSPDSDRSSEETGEPVSSQDSEHTPGTQDLDSASDDESEAEDAEDLPPLPDA
ncbi:MAG: SMP-30/gluconolactonase/LRE family protein [bacterium]